MNKEKMQVIVKPGEWASITIFKGKGDLLTSVDYKVKENTVITIEEKDGKDRL